MISETQHTTIQHKPAGYPITPPNKEKMERFSRSEPRGDEQSCCQKLLQEQSLNALKKSSRTGLDTWSHKPRDAMGNSGFRVPQPVTKLGGLLPTPSTSVAHNKKPYISGRRVLQPLDIE
ncbi:unnamed protein product, partial [Cuscuta epithymum]